MCPVSVLVELVELVEFLELVEPVELLELGALVELVQLVQLVCVCGGVRPAGSKWPRWPERPRWWGHGKAEHTPWHRKAFVYPSGCTSIMRGALPGAKFGIPEFWNL